MIDDRPIMLFVSDRAVLSSLQFSLVLEGFTLADGSAQGACALPARCLVIDQRYRGDGLAFLNKLRGFGVTAPATLLITYPTKRQHQQAIESGAVVVEKPLLSDELTRTLRTLLNAPEQPER